MRALRGLRRHLAAIVVLVALLGALALGPENPARSLTPALLAVALATLLFLPHTH